MENFRYFLVRYIGDAKELCHITDLLLFGPVFIYKIMLLERWYLIYIFFYYKSNPSFLAIPIPIIRLRRVRNIVLITSIADTVKLHVYSLNVVNVLIWIFFFAHVSRMWILRFLVAFWKYSILSLALIVGIFLIKVPRVSKITILIVINKM